MFLETLAQKFRRFRSTNATDASFPSRGSTLTAPSGTGNSAAQATASAVFLLRDVDCNEGAVQNRVLLMPFGAGSDNNTCSVRLYAWSLYQELGSTTDALWVPVLLCELACTLSGFTGATNGVLGTTQRFADTITVTTGNAGVSIDVVSPTGDVAGHAVVDFKGGERLELTTTTGGSATSVNALARMY